MAFGRVKVKVDSMPYNSIDSIDEAIEKMRVDALRQQGCSVITRETLTMPNGRVIVRLSSERPKTQAELNQDLKDQVEFQKLQRK